MNPVLKEHFRIRTQLKVRITSEGQELVCGGKDMDYVIAGEGIKIPANNLTFEFELNGVKKIISTDPYGLAKGLDHYGYVG